MAKICKRGHASKRYADGHCAECRSLENKQRYKRDPEKMRKRTKRWRQKNYERAITIDRKWRIAHPDKIKAKTMKISKISRRENKLKYQYGITLLEFDTILARQGNVCAICKAPKSGHWHVDHDHKTDEVRGVLCRSCNLLLGFAKDNPRITEAATRYLSKCANIGEPVRRHEVIPLDNPIMPTPEPIVPLPIKEPEKPILEPVK